MATVPDSLRIVKRRKPKSERKEDSIRIRVTAEQKRLLTEAATHVGLGLSAWMLSTCLREAQRPREP